MMEIYGLADKYEEYYLKPKGERTPLLNDEVQAIATHWKVVEKSASDSRCGAIFETSVEYNSIHLNWIRFLARAKFIFSHPYFSDYELPFLIAFFSLLTIPVGFLLKN